MVCDKQSVLTEFTSCAGFPTLFLLTVPTGNFPQALAVASRNSFGIRKISEFSYSSSVMLDLKFTVKNYTITLIIVSKILAQTESLFTLLNKIICQQPTANI